MLKTYKTELDLNNKQKTQFIKYCGVTRFVYNWALADRKSRYEQGLTTNLNDQKKRFNAIKDKQFPWVREVAYVVMESAFINCDMAYKGFFRRVRTGNVKAGFPRFKSRKRGLGGITFRGQIHAKSSTIQLPRIGDVRLKEKNYLPTCAKILFSTVSERAGHWFVSIHVEELDSDMQKPHSDVIGVDMGIKILATCSNGVVFENPRVLHSYAKKLAHAHRELSRRYPNSENYSKSSRKLARLHYRMSNIRRYSLHQVSSYLTAKAKPETIVLEDLNVANMLRVRRLGKAIMDASFAELRRQLEYKCAWNGINLVVADRFYPSSKICSSCGVKKPLLKLSERTFVCESCGAVIDRDFNASLNLAKLGSSSLNLEPPNKRGLPVEGTCGHFNTRTDPMKQEPSIVGTQVGIGLPDKGIFVKRRV